MSINKDNTTSTNRTGDMIVHYCFICVLTFMVGGIGMGIPVKQQLYHTIVRSTKKTVAFKNMRF